MFARPIGAISSWSQDYKTVGHGIYGYGIYSQDIEIYRNPITGHVNIERELGFIPVENGFPAYGSLPGPVHHQYISVWWYNLNEYCKHFLFFHKIKNMKIKVDFFDLLYTFGKILILYLSKTCWYSLSSLCQFRKYLCPTDASSKIVFQAIKDPSVPLESAIIQLYRTQAFLELVQ